MVDIGNNSKIQSNLQANQNITELKQADSDLVLFF